MEIRPGVFRTSVATDWVRVAPVKLPVSLLLMDLRGSLFSETIGAGVVVYGVRYRLGLHGGEAREMRSQTGMTFASAIGSRRASRYATTSA